MMQLARLARIARRATATGALSAAILAAGALPAADAGSFQDPPIPPIGGGATPSPSPSPRPAAKKQPSDARLFQLHNNERERHHLHSLATESSLTSFARRRATEMAEAEDVWHSKSLPAGERWEVVGENVGRATTVEEVFEGFLSSSSHRANVLRAGFRAVGIGVASNGGAQYVAVVYGQPWPAARTAAARTAAARTAVAPTAAATWQTAAPDVAALRPPPPAETQSVMVLVRLVALEQ